MAPAGAARYGHGNLSLTPARAKGRKCCGFDDGDDPAVGGLRRGQFFDTNRDTSDDIRSLQPPLRWHWAGGRNYPTKRSVPAGLGAPGS